MRTRSAEGSPVKRVKAVNDFVIKFANVNGSGSASANELFAKAIMRMGVPVSPRNIFPSNIQGLPTWYEVRVTEKGYLGRRGGIAITGVGEASRYYFGTEVSDLDLAQSADTADLARAAAVVRLVEEDLALRIDHARCLAAFVDDATEGFEEA